MKTPLTVVLSASLLAAPVFAEAEDHNNHLPRLDHAFVIMMENHGFQQIIGYARTANLATNYFAVGHPSLTNYLEVVGGSNFGVTSDNYPNWHHGPNNPNLINPIGGTGMDVATPANTGPFNTAIPAAYYTGATIGDQLAAANMRWKSYQEDLPTAGADKVNYSDGSFSNVDTNVDQTKVQALYAVKHNPFAYFDSVQRGDNPANSLANIVGFDGIEGLYADLRAGKVPELSLISPNQCHDMHGAANGSAFCTADASTITMGDQSVQKLVDAIKNSPTWREGNNAIFVVWDENDYSATPNQVVTIVDTNYGVKGTTSNKPYTHFSLLKTLETSFGLNCLNHACDNNVHVMDDLLRAR
jgi:phospholipase C